MLHLDDGMLNALLDKELSGAELREAEEHLRACPECGRRLDEYRQVMGEADSLIAAIQVPPAPATAGGGKGPPQAQTWVRYRAIGLAAVLTLAVGLGFWGSQLLQAPAREAKRAAAGTGEAPAASQPVAAANDATDSAAPNDAPPPATLGEALARTRASGRRSSDSARDSLGTTDRLRPGGPPALAMEVPPPTADAEAGQPENHLDAPAEERARRDLASGELQGNTAAGSGAGALQSQSQTSGVSAKSLADAPAPSQAARPRRQEAEQANVTGITEPGFKRVTLEEAVKHLGGTIRLVGGLTPDHVEMAEDADSSNAVVRVVYADVQGTRLLLDQRRGPLSQGFARQSRVREADAADEIAGTVTLAWTDQDGVQLVLSGPVSADSLAKLKARVR